MAQAIATIKFGFNVQRTSLAVGEISAIVEEILGMIPEWHHTEAEALVERYNQQLAEIAECLEVQK